jgi:predicted nucleic acid-binding protein
MYLLDTDVLIDIQRGHAPAINWFSSLTELPSVPGFVVMELVQDSQNSQQVRKALQLVAPLPVVWATEADCVRALSDFTAYHLSHSRRLAMSVALSLDVLQDDIAVTTARVVASANKRARELNVDVMQSIISLTQHSQDGSWIWRVNYGAKDYIGRRGGDLMVEVNPEDASIQRVLWGQ